MSRYDHVNEKLIELIKSGHVPWRSQWKSVPPRSMATGETYKGMRNVMLLNAAPYDSPFWISADRAKQMGGHVKKGEKSYPIVWFGTKTIEEDGQTVPILVGTPVFNVEQCEGLVYAKPEPQRIVINIDRAEGIIKRLDADIVWAGNRACYSPSDDNIQMPSQDRFVNDDSRYYVLFHELVHWTGAKSRCNRRQGLKGTKLYDFEELVAEIGASYLAREVGLDMNLINDAAAYIQHYISPKDYEKLLKGDKTLFIRASSQAQRAVNYILGVEEKEGAVSEV